MRRLTQSVPGYLINLILVLCLYGAVALDNGLAMQPPMVSTTPYSSVRVALSTYARLCAAQDRPNLQGWNTWNAFHDEINETLVKGAADLLVETGLQAAGYTYLNIDGTNPCSPHISFRGIHQAVTVYCCPSCRTIPLTAHTW